MSIRNPQVVAQNDQNGDFAMIKLKDQPPQQLIFRNQLAIDTNPHLYNFSFSPFISINALEPGCEVFKIGKESNFLAGFMKEGL